MRFSGRGGGIEEAPEVAVDIRAISERHLMDSSISCSDTVVTSRRSFKDAPMSAMEEVGLGHMLVGGGELLAWTSASVVSGGLTSPGVVEPDGTS